MMKQLVSMKEALSAKFPLVTFETRVANDVYYLYFNDFSLLDDESYHVLTGELLEKYFYSKDYYRVCISYSYEMPPAVRQDMAYKAQLNDVMCKIVNEFKDNTICKVGYSTAARTVPVGYGAIETFKGAA